MFIQNYPTNYYLQNNISDMINQDIKEIKEDDTSLKLYLKNLFVLFFSNLTNLIVEVLFVAFHIQREDIYI